MQDQELPGAGVPLPPVGIVVVNFGSSALLRRFLTAVDDECAPDVVVVVDNFSTEAERDMVRVLARDRSWDLLGRDNAGFGAGANVGVARARELGAKSFLLLNPDASIDARSLTLLREAVAKDPRTVAAPRIVDPSGAVWFAGADVYLDDGRTRGAKARSNLLSAERWEWLSGACLLVSDEVWAAAGGFDEDYFLYWEDVDLSRRVVEAGGRLRVVDDATAVHDEGLTHADRRRGREKSPTYYYYSIRNRLLFASKHLDETGVRRWRRSSVLAAWEILLRGGRRQFLRPYRPIRAAAQGIRDGLAMSSLSDPRRHEPTVCPGRGPSRRLATLDSRGGRIQPSGQQALGRPLDEEDSR